MTHIRFISIATIQPTRNSHPHEFTPRIELSPWDLRHLQFDYIQKGLLFHKPNDNLANFTHKEPITSNSLLEHLKDTLSRTLDLFYPLAGRLAVIENDDRTSSVFLHCNGLGAKFVHAAADGITLADILEPTIVPDDLIFSFFQLNEVRDYEGISKPLLAVQVTELLDGIFIGCSINHCAVDGTSFWHFFNTWSQISRGGDRVDHVISQAPPVFGGMYLDGFFNLPIRIPSFKNEDPTEKFVMPPLQRRVFHFSKEKISKLKAKANAEMGTTKISSLQALLSHLWVSITSSRRLNADEEVFYRIVIGMRQRIQPRLPEEFLGNAAIGRFVKSTAGELLKNGLGWAAWEMNKIIASQTSEEVRKLLEDWTKSPRILKLGDIMDGNTKLITSSSPRFDVYGNDFGWGRPIAVRSGPANRCDGNLTVFPGAENGSIDIEACLSPETLQAMADDEELMEIFVA